MKRFYIDFIWTKLIPCKKHRNVFLIALATWLTGSHAFAEDPQYAPQFRILWDISKGAANDPLATYRYGALTPKAEDQNGDFSMDLTLFLRSVFPRSSEVPGEIEDTWQIAFDQEQVNQLADLGTFPDVVVQVPGKEIKGLGYLNISAIGLEEEDLSQYNALIITLATSFVYSYSDEEAAKIRGFVEGGGRLILAGDNFWTPRANVRPIFRAFGFDLAMTLTAHWDHVLAPMASTGPIRSDAGSWLCRGDAEGWFLNYQQYRETLKFGNGVYQKRLKDFTTNYDPLPKDKLCRQRVYNNNDQFSAIVLDSAVGGKRENVEVLYRGDLGKGRAWIFGDGSFITNHILEKSQSNRIFLRSLLEDLVR